MNLRQIGRAAGAAFACALLACSGGDPGTPDGGSPPVGSSCTLTGNTSPSGTQTNGCDLLTRDTSSCKAARQAQGLSGFWLSFSCRVTLTVVTQAGTQYVQLSSDGEPDYRSNYFPSGDLCHDDYTPPFPDPNDIAAQNLVLTVPQVPSGSGQEMALGPVGMAVNGVAIFDNQAAPGDDIYLESGSFDRCQGHPQQNGMYHYHSEPYAISYDDARFIGVLRDGNPLYGRRDPDGSLPSLDAAGGHVGVTSDSATPVYHHHVNLQTSANAGTAGQTAWFLTTGQYANTPH